MYPTYSDMPFEGEIRCSTELSIRAQNCLMSKGMWFIEEVEFKTDKELLAVKNLGRITLTEIRMKYKEYRIKQLEKKIEKKWRRFVPLERSILSTKIYKEGKCEVGK